VSYRGILSLFGLEEHKPHRDVYAESVRRGSYVLAVDAESDAQLERVTEIMDRHGAVDIDERSSHWKRQGWSGYDENAPMLGKDEIEQERRSYAQARSSAIGDATQQPLAAGVQPATGGSQTQRGGVRIFRHLRETQPGASGTSGTMGSGAMSGDDADFRQHWKTAYGTSGGRYEDYDAAYRYGSTVASSGRYKNYQWTDVEPDLRSDWEAHHPESAWEKVKDAVRYGAEHVTGRH
jgi:hypothetical protein